jgi:hypothetical protein
MSKPKGVATFAKSFMEIGFRSFSAKTRAKMFAGEPIGRMNPPTLTAKISATGSNGLTAANCNAIGAKTAETGILSMTAERSAGTHAMKIIPSVTFPPMRVPIPTPIASMTPVISSAATSQKSPIRKNIVPQFTRFRISSTYSRASIRSAEAIVMAIKAG